MASYDDNKSRLSRRDAVGMDFLVEAFIKEMKLSSGLNVQRIYAAWDEVSHAGPYTVRKYVKDNVLYCSISSSALRQQLYMRRRELLDGINEQLLSDPLFTRDDKKNTLLKNIVLQ